MKRKHPELLDLQNGQKNEAGRRVAENARDSTASNIESIPAHIQAVLDTPDILEGVVGGIDSWIGRMNMPQSQTHHGNEAPSSNTISTSSVPMKRKSDDYVSNHMQRSSPGESRHTAPFIQEPIENLMGLPTFENVPDTPSVSAVSNEESVKSYIPDGLSSKDVAYLDDDWFPSPTQSAKGYRLYFEHVARFVPFLHRPTFDATETAPELGLSMLCLAYQHGEDPDCGFEEAGSGTRLSQRCFHRARVVAASEEEQANDLAGTINLVQTYWLLQVYVMMYRCGDDSIYGPKLHSRMIYLTRFGGLTQPISKEPTKTDSLDDLWKGFIKAESHKRTLLAVHQIDALWYQLFSIPRSLSHLEIKHDLPCQEDLWTACSSAIWAHRKLESSQSAPLVPYSDVVRIFLSSNPDIDSLPNFDLYGAINIAQFLLSSAREMSGWSTMTGRLSLERFGPLQSSLLALERLIRPNGETATSTHAISCEATWEMAMLELLVWSSSHTSGVVGGSVDSFLKQSTEHAASSSSMQDVSANNDIQPHIDWFLLYLDNNMMAEGSSEPPWLTLYAYKAFLIAWQLLRQGLPGAMKVVGIRDGDCGMAVLWARRVFHREHQRQLTKLIGSCLDILDANSASRSLYST